MSSSSLTVKEEAGLGGRIAHHGARTNALNLHANAMARRPLCRKAGLQGVTLHVLRHTFAATAAEMGFSELTIAGLLGHKVPGLTARYAHVPDSALVSAADRISARINAALHGEE